MNGYCEIKIGDSKVGVLFGVRLFEIIKNEKLEMSNRPDDMMNLVHILWAGIKNNCDFEKIECPYTVKDIYILMNEDIAGFEAAIKCFSESKVLGKTVEETSDELKKKMKNG